MDTKKNERKYLRSVASVSIVAKVFRVSKKFQKLFKDIPDMPAKFLKIEHILDNDDANAFSFPELIEATKEFILSVPADLRHEIFEELKIHVSTYRIKKLTELKYDNSYNVVNKTVDIGNHTQQSHLEKATQEAIDLKLNLLNEFEKWLLANAEIVKNHNDSDPKRDTKRNKMEEDVDFIQNKRKEWFQPTLNAKTNVIEYYYVVEKNEERRQYSPTEFLNLVLEAHYLAADRSQDYNEQLRCIINAESVIKRYIYENDLTAKGFSFDNIFSDLDVTRRRIKAYRDLPISSENLKVKTDEEIKNVNPKPENNIIESTIEDYIIQFKEDKSINELDYTALVNILLKFFEKNKSTILIKPLFVRNGNKKRLGYALGEIFKSLKNEALSFEYLELGKKNISIYNDEQIDKTKFNKSNLYKYYTTKP